MVKCYYYYLVDKFCIQGDARVKSRRCGSSSNYMSHKSTLNQVGILKIIYLVYRYLKNREFGSINPLYKSIWSSSMHFLWTTFWVGSTASSDIMCITVPRKIHTILLAFN